MTNFWKKYAGDFNSLTDEEVERLVKESQDIIDREEEWQEAVVSWKQAGKPRREDA